MTKPRVFISSSSQSLGIAQELARQLESTSIVMLWPEAAFLPGKTTAESFKEVANRSDFAVFVLASDYADAYKTGWSANVFFEMGLFAGTIGFSRTFVIADDNAFLPSDLAGTLVIKLAGDRPSLSEAVAPAASTIARSIARTHLARDIEIEDPSYFISYSAADKEFAARLHDDLEEIGIRCWLDAPDMNIGKEIGVQIEKAMQAHERILLVLSKASLQSSWVKWEVQNALRLEHERKKTVLFPLRIDNAVFDAPAGEEIKKVIQRHIGDFSDWLDKSAYQRAFSKLVRDLAISASVESSRVS